MFGILAVVAHLAFAAAALFVALVALLHVLEPEFQPSWRMISEYATGRYGWIMRVAFFAWAASCFALALALARQLPPIATALLFLEGIGLLGAGAFSTDLMTVPREQQSRSGRLHVLFSTLVIVGFPIAATVITANLAAHDAWASVRPFLISITALIWISTVSFVAAIVHLTRNTGALEANSFSGWVQRFMVLTFVTWLMALASQD
jgi:hypothetical protein